MDTDENSSRNLFEDLGYDGKKPTMSLLMGAPGEEILKRCAGIMQKATTHRLEQESSHGQLFQYGARLGDWNFRKNLAQFLSERYFENVQMKNLLVTCGASHGLYMAASLLFSKGCTVFVEDPTYFIAFNVFTNDLHMNVVPVPLDEEGIRIGILEEKVIELSKQTQDQPQYYQSMLYLIPAYQNPTGICYSEKRCKDLITFAEKHNVLLLCDDVYNMLHYTQSPPPKPIFFYEELSSDTSKGHVISNCTFSKILGPGMRLGWIQTSQYIMNLFSNSGVIRSGGNFNNYTSGIISSLIEMGLQQKYLNELIALYGKRMRLIGSILKKELPSGCNFSESGGGYFFWISLPHEVNAEKFSIWLDKNYKVIVLPGNRCSALGNFGNYIRIAITYLDDVQLLAAVQKFCEGMNNYVNLTSQSKLLA